MTEERRLLTDQEKRDLRKALLELAMGDVFKSLRYSGEPDNFKPTNKLNKGAAPLAAVILCCSISETCGRLYCGAKGNDCTVFKGFLRKCVNPCSPSVSYSIVITERIYKAVRCGLVHSMSTQKDRGKQDRFLLIRSPKEQHLEQLKPKSCAASSSFPSSSFSEAATGTRHESHSATGSATVVLPVTNYLHVQTFAYDVYRGVKHFLDVELEREIIQQNCAEIIDKVGILSVFEETSSER